MIKRFRINSTRVFIDSMALAIKFLELTHSSSQHRAHKYSFYWAFFVGLTSSQLVRSSEKIMNEIKSTTKKRFSKYWPLRYLIIKLENAIGTNNIIGMRQIAGTSTQDIFEKQTFSYTSYLYHLFWKQLNRFQQSFIHDVIIYGGLQLRLRFNRFCRTLLLVKI